ncbi:inner nuclear membrane protein Man1 isoform X2 [Prorops nasuta]|uniref:inner nuclear membrane protein Man1 isoform X2 n=1 Tax=Prorops nasuta TaxID=863751 RepID=UPI0034CD9756
MSVDSLTDPELRSKLAEYGYPVGPVTQTTRKILVKKLKNLIETRGNKGTRHSLAARYSSDDTDDDTSSTTTKKKKVASSSRRQTLASPMPPPSSVPLSSNILSSSQSTEVKDAGTSGYDGALSYLNRSVNKSSLENVQKKNTRTYGLGDDDFETGSDSDIAEVTHVTASNKPRTTHTVGEVKHIESGYKPGLSYKKNDLTTKDNKTQDVLANYETPFLSEFTRRLSAQSANYPSLSYTKRFPSSITQSRETTEKDLNGTHLNSYRSLYSSSMVRNSLPVDKSQKTINRSYKSPSTREDIKNNQNMISMILVIIVALFFGALAVIYSGLGGKSESLPSLSSDSDIPLCPKGTLEQKTPGVHCVSRENLEAVLQLLKRLHPILLKNAISVVCDNASETPYLMDSDIVKMFTSNKVKAQVVQEDLKSAQLLVIKNPNWGISLIDVTESNGNLNQALTTMDQLFSTRLSGNLGMIILNPLLPMQCRIKNTLFVLFSALLIAAIGALTIIGTRKLFLWYLKYKKSTESKVMTLVSDIIDVVQNHHFNTASSEGSQDRYVAINHVRDNLIPPKSRKKLAGLWDKAVKFLDENESRIRREVQRVAGEEFFVWRWLPNNNLNISSMQGPTSTKKAKVWQGQAFETMEGSVNSLTCSPTPCLKIRHMFDLDMEVEEDWEVKVHDAILEKCGEGVKVLHIGVDHNSREGCVYIKCASEDDAGKAYRALHGCWFDGNLVTVKYLRLERYHERFPTSKRCTTPLKPSNNQRLSMQAQYGHSPLEAN